MSALLLTWEVFRSVISRFLNQLEARVGRYRGIRNLITIVVAAMAIVYVADYVLGPVTGFYLSEYLEFNRTLVFRGQVWRLVTFVVTPPNESILFIVLQLMFVYFTGNMLENHWGTFRFNLFYLCGLLGSLVSGLITGYATSYYVNLSLLLAVAILYPAMQVNLYGILPVRMKWLALIELLLLIPGLMGGWGQRIAIIVSLLNVLLFFSERLIEQAKNAKRRYEWKKNWRR